MRSVRLLCATLMTAAALVAVGATTQPALAAGSKSLSFSRPSVIANETIQIDGTLPTAMVRTVRLQYRTGTSGAWTTRLTTQSASNGFFFFVVKNTKTRYWRYSVPGGGGHPAITGYAKRLPVVPQKVEYFAATRNCDSATKNVVTAWADFYPAREGREVDFVTPEGVVTAYQDNRGIARVTVVTSDIGVANLTATARPIDGAAAKTTPTTTVALPVCNPI